MNIPKFRMESTLAELRWGWFPEASNLLSSRKPGGLFIEGDWSGERLTARDVESITYLKIGTQEYDLSLVEKFRNLIDLEILAKPKRKPVQLKEVSPVLTSLSTPWLGSAMSRFLNSSSLKRVLLRSVPDLAFEAVDKVSGVESLTIVQSSLTSLSGISNFSHLRSLDAAHCPKLICIEGVRDLPLESLRLESTKAVENIAVITSLKQLQRLIIVSISTKVDLTPCIYCDSICVLQIGGKGMPILDWGSAIRLPKIEKIFAWWDPNVLSRTDIEILVDSVGKSVLRIDCNASLAVQVLFVELGVKTA